MSNLESKPFGRQGLIGDWIGLGILNAGYIAYQYFNEDDQSTNGYTNLSYMAKSTYYAMFWVVLMKATIKERRPGDPDDQKSFPSGHAAASFAFAGSIAVRHGWGYGALAYSVASFVAVSRLNDDYHYLHDVLAGATIGSAYAWGLDFLGIEKSSNMVIYPVALPENYSLNLIYQF